MGVVETVMTEKEWKKHNKDWLEGYVCSGNKPKIQSLET